MKNGDIVVEKTISKLNRKIREVYKGKRNLK